MERLRGITRRDIEDVAATVATISRTVMPPAALSAQASAIAAARASTTASPCHATEVTAAAATRFSYPWQKPICSKKRICSASPPSTWTTSVCTSPRGGPLLPTLALNPSDTSS
jgi:hypothetical protein